MLKRAFAFIFLLAFATQTFSRAFIMLDYYFNTKAYAKDCENKARPKMHCNGKCQMMKKLKQEEKKDEQNPNRKIDNKEELVLSSKSFFPQFEVYTIEQKIKFSFLSLSKEIKMPRFFFHPPTVLA